MMNHSVRFLQHQVTQNNIVQLPPASSFINNLKKGTHVKLKSLSLSKIEDISEKYAKERANKVKKKGRTKGLVTRQDTIRTGKKIKSTINSSNVSVNLLLYSSNGKRSMCNLSFPNLSQF